MKDTTVIVAIGASAGGLEALQSVLSNFPKVENLAIIIAQHLSPTHKSRLTELLTRETSLSVKEAENGLNIESGTVYITPPDSEISVKKGRINLVKPAAELGPKPSVNTLFSSLSEYAPLHTVGVILSGTGSDGAEGVKFLKKAGGYLIAQEPKTAKYDGMPLAAIQSGYVDSVVSPEMVGQEIKDYIDNPSVVATESVEEVESNPLQQILGLLSARSGTDFFHYKKATIGRRIDKRMAYLGLNKLPEYLEVLEKDNKEIDKLFKTVLIGVTSFYRDPDSFSALTQQLKQLLESKEPGDDIRIWIPACSSGEEAYTCAIELHKLLGSRIAEFNIQIFATDIDENAIKHGRKGVFSIEALKDVNQQTADTYFDPVDDGNQIKKHIRSLVLFSKHDVLNNAPFLKLDLISCRNLLIYFNRTLQEEVIPIFHYALNPDGILFLGKSETVGHFSDLFTTISGKHKIYRRKKGGSPRAFNFARTNNFQLPESKKNSKNPTDVTQLSSKEKVKETLYKTYEHPYVVVDESLNIQEVNGDLRLFLTLPSGDMQSNLVKMVNEELQIEVRSVTNKCIRNREAVTGSIKKFELFGNSYFVRILCKPVLYTDDSQLLFIVIFEQLDILNYVKGSTGSSEYDSESARIQELEHELALTKEQLQSYIEEIETSNEELQSLNEELQSTNEELQSTNEELETSNEELQSTNEEVQIAYQELRTTNKELERKEKELKSKDAKTQALLNNDLQAFLLLDKTYKIISYNKVSAEILSELTDRKLEAGNSFIDMLPSDQVEKFVRHFEKPLEGNNYSYVEKIKGLDDQNRWYKISYTPVKVDNAPIEGISIAIQDITELKQTASDLSATEQLVNSVFDATTTGICITDENGKFVDVNKKYCEIYGYEKAELIGEKFTTVVSAKHKKKLQQLHDEFIEGKEELPAEFQVVDKYGNDMIVATSATRLRQEDGRIYKVTSVRNITEQKFNQSQIDLLSKNLPGVLFQYRKFPNGADELVHVSDGATKMWGYEPEKCLSNNELVWNQFHEEDLPKVLKSIEESQKNMDYWTAEWRYHHPDGNTYWHRGTGYPREGENGSIIWDSIILDITSEKEKELEVLRLKNNQNALINSTKDLIWSVDRDLCLITANQAYLDAVDDHFDYILQPGDSLTMPLFGDQLISKWGTYFEQALNGKPADETIRSLGPKGSGKPTFKRITFNPIWHHGNVTGVACFVKDVSDETIQKQQLLRATEVAKLGYWELSLDTQNIFWSDEVYEIWGEDKDSFKPTLEKLKATIHEADLPEFEENHKKAINGEIEHDIVHRIRTKSGAVKWVHEKGGVETDENGKPKSFSGTVQDVTAQKEEEQHLRLLQSVVTEADDSILITEAEPLDKPGPKIIYVNDAFTKMTGYTAEEVIGKTPRMLQGPKTDYDELKKISKSLRNWETCELTTINYRKNGEEFWNNFRMIPVANEGGWYTHWIAIERDVTDEINERLQKELLVDVGHALNSELSFQSSVNRIMEFIVKKVDIEVSELWLVDRKEKHITLVAEAEQDKQFEPFHGPGKFQQFKFGEGLPGICWKKNEVTIWNDLANHKEYKRQKSAYKAGIEAAFGIPIYYADDVYGVIVLGTDGRIKDKRSIQIILDNFQTYLGGELKRKQIEQELMLIYETVPDIIVMVDREGRFVSVNKSAGKILGYDQDELIGMHFMDIVHPDDVSATQEEFSGLKDGKETFYFENRYIRKDSSIVWLAWTGIPDVEEGYVFSVAKDITESKKLQNLLDEATELATIGAWEVDLENDKIYWSDVTKRIHEVPEDYEPELESSINFYLEGDSKEKIREGVEKAINEGESWNIEAEMVTYKGNNKWVRAIGKPHFVDNSCVRLSGSFQDITERKKAELNAISTLKEKEKILESINDGFFTIDKEWKIDYWNKSAQELTGVEAETVLGQNLYEVFPDAKGSIFEERYEKAVKNNEPEYFEGFYNDLNMWVDVSAYPTDDGISVYFKDVTERKKTLNKLRISQDRFEKATKATQDAIWDWDIENEEMYWGHGFYSKFGYPVKTGKYDIESWTGAIHPDDLDAVTKSVYSAIDNPDVENWEAEYKFRKKNGEYAFVLDRGYVMRNNDGKAVRMVGAMTDISEQKQYEESLEKLNRELSIRARELAASNAELEQFAYVASHDLQEPLRMVTSFLTQLEKKYGDQLDDKAHQYIEFAVDGGRRMRQIILDLLEYSRVGKSDDDLEILDMNELMNEVKLLFQKRISETNAHLKIGNLPSIESFRSPIQRVFHNLIDNALKYRDPGRDLVIEISGKEKEDGFLFSIKDNGEGIENEYLDQIFVIFKRMHTQDEVSGTGMGLSIVKKIIDTLGGNISVSSTPNMGTEFQVYLPKDSGINHE